MKTVKKIGIVLFILCIALMLPKMTNAAVTVEREMYSNNGSMKYTFTGLELDTTHEYEFGLGRTAAATIEEWHLITDYTATSAVVDVMTTTDDLREVINDTDTGYITIRDKSDSSVVVEPTALI